MTSPTPDLALGPFRALLLATALLLVPVVSGQAPGFILGEQKIGAASGGLLVAPELGDAFGAALVALGDLDGDGIAELAAGVPQPGNDPADALGEVWILFLGSDGRVRDQTRIGGGGLNGGPAGLSADATFGQSVAALGDLDGDGVPDLAVGDSHDPGDGTAQGAIWVLLLNPDGTVKQRNRIAEGSSGFTGQLSDFDLFGFAAAGLGDLDGDGSNDLAVAARGNDTVYLLFLEPGGNVDHHVEISGEDVSEGNSASFGAALAGVGDIDADGVPDLAVGDPFLGSLPRRGGVWLLMLNADGSVDGSVLIDQSSDGFTAPPSMFDFGAAVGAVGDLDRDGIPDLGVGAPKGIDAAWDGAAWWFLLTPDGSIKAQHDVWPGVGGLTGEVGCSATLGAALTGLGDIDGDGDLDVALADPTDGVVEDESCAPRGAVYVLFTTDALDARVRLRDTIEGSLAPGEAHVLGIEIVAGSLVTLKARRTAGELQPELRLEDGCGEVLVDFAQTATSTKVAVLKKQLVLASGHHRLSVRNAGTAAGSYKLTTKAKLPRKVKAVARVHPDVGDPRISFGAEAGTLITKVRARALKAKGDFETIDGEVSALQPVIVGVDGPVGSSVSLAGKLKPSKNGKSVSAKKLPLTATGTWVITLDGVSGSVGFAELKVSLKPPKLAKAKYVLD